MLKLFGGRIAKPQYSILRGKLQLFIAVSAAYALVYCILTRRFDNWEARIVQWLPTSVPESPSDDSRSREKHYPQVRFRDALHEDKRYITAFQSSGWMNQVIATLHLIDIAIYANRIPVLSPFAPTHLPQLASFLPVSGVFDLDLLSSQLGIPILEWQDLKDTSTEYPAEVEIARSRANASNVWYAPGYFGGDLEPIGCWDVSATLSAGAVMPRTQNVPLAYSLDISWTPLPFGHTMEDRFGHVQLAQKAFLAHLGHNASVHEASVKDSKDNFVSTSTKRRGGRPPIEFYKDVPTFNGKKEQVDPDPAADASMLCFDYIFYSAWEDPSENLFAPTSPMWTKYGTHLRFKEQFEMESLILLHAALSLPPPTSLKFPPYIAVHVRRGDFGDWCKGYKVGLEGCLPPISTYARRVDDMRRALAHNRPDSLPDSLNISDIPVIIFTDEPRETSEWFLNRWHRPPGSSENFWKQVDAVGWNSMDHNALGTEQTHGKWHTITVDSCLMANAVAFVGTDRSTYSGLSARRVETWMGGPTYLVKWGLHGADE